MPRLSMSLIIGFQAFEHHSVSFLTKTVTFTCGKYKWQFDRSISQLEARNCMIAGGVNSVEIDLINSLPITLNLPNCLPVKLEPGKRNYNIHCDQNKFVDLGYSLSNSMINTVTTENTSKPHYRKSIKLPPLDMTNLSVSSKFPSEIRDKANQLLRNLVGEFHHVFSRSDCDLGSYNGAQKYEIKLQNTIVDMYKVPRRSKADEEFVREEVDKLLKSGIVEKTSDSKIYCGFVVAKAKGKKRLCLDSRNVNRESVSGANFPLPDIQEILATISNHRFYASLDMNKAYWQIPLPPSQRYLYTFCCGGQTYRFTRSSFGTRSMSSHFCAIMAEVLGHLENVVTYLDDILVFGDDLETMIETLRKVFDRFSFFNLTLGLEKCKFLDIEISAFGYSVDRNGYRPDPKRLDKLLEIPLPETKRKLQSALGGLNYYRLSSPKFKSHALYFYDKIDDYKYDENDKTKWKKLLSCFKDCVARHRPDFSKPVTLKTDSSENCAGYTICQKDGDTEKILKVDGRKLTGSVLLAKIAFKELFSLYIALKDNEKFINLFPIVRIVTDNKTVFYLLKKLHDIQIDKMSSPVRWCIFIASFRYEAFHSSGEDESFILTDMMSRLTAGRQFPIKFGKLTSDLLVCEPESTSLNINSVLELKDVLKSFDYSKMRSLVREWQKKYPIKPSSKDIVFDEIVYTKKGHLRIPSEKVYSFLDMIHTHAGVRNTLNLISQSESNCIFSFSNCIRLIFHLYKNLIVILFMRIFFIPADP